MKFTYQEGCTRRHRHRFVEPRWTKDLPDLTDWPGKNPRVFLASGITGQDTHLWSNALRCLDTSNEFKWYVWSNMYLVGGLNPSEKIWKSIGMIIPNIWENNKWQPNHQPENTREGNETWRFRQSSRKTYGRSTSAVWFFMARGTPHRIRTTQEFHSGLIKKTLVI